MITISLIVTLVSAAVYLWSKTPTDIKQLALVGFLCGLLTLLMGIGARVVI